MDRNMVSVVIFFDSNKGKTEPMVVQNDILHPKHELQPPQVLLSQRHLQEIHQAQRNQQDKSNIVQIAVSNSH